MHIYFMNLQEWEDLTLPSIFEISGYKVYFWSKENSEPIHVHVSKDKPSSNSTKIWITKAGGTIVANNKSNIPDVELNKLLEIISAQYFLICSEWKKHFILDKITFYC